MCFQYKCVDCNQTKHKHCTKFDDNTKKCGAIVEEVLPGEKYQKCRTCVTIKGAINSLRHLVFREPWLATEGLSGAPKKESWDVDNQEDQNYDSGGEDEDGYIQEKRKTVREEAERAVAQRWGLMKREQEQEQEAHKGQSTSGTES